MSELPRSAESLGERLRALRHQAGLTQAELSRRMQAIGHTSIYIQTIVKIEAGSRKLSFLEGLAVAGVLGIDPKDLAPESDAAPHPALADPRPGIQQAIEILRAEAARLRS